MQNPFSETEAQPGDPCDEELVASANSGDRDSLERLIRRHQAWVYNLVVRMVWRTNRAEDITQEVLVKIITKLSTFEGRSRFRTWAYRIAANHVLNVGKSQMEQQGITFTDLGQEMDGMPDSDLPDRSTIPVDLPLLVEEAKVGCTTAMLMCLDRRQRLAFILGEMFGASDDVGAEIMEVTPDNFRQILSRSRRDLYSFMNDKCGLVNANNPCRCAKKTKAFIERGYLDPQRLQFTSERATAIRQIAPSRLADLQGLVERQHAEVFRDHSWLPVRDQVAVLRRILNAEASHPLIDGT